MRQPKLSGFLFLCICITSLLGGCSFDDDQGFVPVTKAGYFLAQDPLTKNHSILQVKDEIAFQDWEQTLNISSGNLSDMQGRNNRLWLALKAEGEIWEVDPFSETVLRKIQLEGFQPNHLCIGDEFILISDSVRKIAVFMDMKTETLYEREMEETPGRAVYRSKKFFLQTGNSGISIWREEAIAQLNFIELGAPIIDLVLDDGKETYAHLKDTGYAFGRIDYNSNQLVAPIEETTLIKQRFSPYLRRNFGKELLGSIGLDRDNNLVQLGFSEVNSMEVDFLEAKIYFQKADSLYLTGLDKNPVSLVPFSDSLCAAFFFAASASQ